MIEVDTTRFGAVGIEADDILLFPSGLPGLDDLHHWILLADAENDALAWLQCISRPDIALAVVSPRRFVADYQVRVARSELTPLQLDADSEAHVVVVVGKNELSLTLNLKAPLIINLQRRLGRQVIVNDDQPLQFELAPRQAQLRKSA